MKLYEIPEKYEVLEKMYEEAIDDETGEIKELEFAQAQEYENILKELLSDKLDNMIKFIKNKESDINMIKEEEKRLKKRREGMEKRMEWLKGYILFNMQRLDFKKVESTFGTLSQRKSKSTIIDENIIPKDERYWSTKIENKFDKTKIKKLIESGEKIEGAYIQENISLAIK